LTAAEVDLLITTAVAIGNSLASPGDSSVERAAEIYLDLVSRLLEFQTLLFTETSRAHLLVRTQTRLRTLAQSYRYFAACPASESVSLSTYLTELRELFQSIQAVEFEMDPISLPMQRAMDVAVIVSEALAVIGDVDQSEFNDARLIVSLRRLDDRVEITLTARTADGVPIGNGLTPDPMALALFHGLQERFDAKISTTGFDGLLFRLSFRQV
jgi:two-component sensor histidine kinase